MSGRGSTILVHTIFYRPELVGVGAYTAAMCEWLTAAGHNVKVVCPPPYYPDWRVKAPYRSWKYHSETWESVSVTRCPIWVPRKTGGWKRVAYGVSFALASFPVMLWEARSRPDVVFVVEPSLLNSIASLIVSKLTGAKSWLHIQDLEIDIACDLMNLGKGRLGRLVRKAEAWIMRRFDVVSTISGPMMERVAAKGVDAERRYLFPNWVDTDSIRPLPCASPVRRELGIADHQVVALYSGTMGRKHGIDVLLNAARRLQADLSIRFLFCGAGDRWERLRIESAGLPNVQAIPLQPRERLNDLLNAADIHLLSQRPEVADLVMPSKLLGMAASGRPIVAAVRDDSEVARVVSKCGFVVAPNDVDGVADKVRRLADDRLLRISLGDRARQYALDHFGQEAILRTFEARLKEPTAPDKVEKRTPVEEFAEMP